MINIKDLEVIKTTLQYSGKFFKQLSIVHFDYKNNRYATLKIDKHPIKPGVFEINFEDEESIKIEARNSKGFDFDLYINDEKLIHQR